MVDSDKWMKKFLSKIRSEFGDRLLYMGLQGSQRRGEAKPDSDIDIVAVFDKLELEDLDLYRRVLLEMPDNPRPCGFICNREDLLNWSKSDLFILKHDAKDYWGRLTDILPQISPDAGIEAAKKDVADTLHFLIHSWTFGSHEEREKAINDAVKRILFTCFLVEFIRSGVYYPDRTSLRANTAEDMAEVLSLDERNYSAKKKYEILIGWLRKQLDFLSSLAA